MFIWSSRAILDAIAKCKPEMHEFLMNYSKSIETPDEADARMHLFKNSENVSIDVGVLEQADNVLVIKGELIWDDVGTWRSLERIAKLDIDNNVVHGGVVKIDTYESTLYNDDADGLIASIGVSDLVIVKSSGVTLVVHRSRAKDIPKLLAKLREDGKFDEYL